MRTKTIERRNEFKKYLHIIHLALSLSSEPRSEAEFKYVEKNLRPRLYGENLSRVEGSPAYPSYPG